MDASRDCSTACNARSARSFLEATSQHGVARLMSMRKAPIASDASKQVQ